MSNGPIRLRNAQRAIRDVYFDHESGLFTLDCVPGSGKSVVAHHIAAESILCRYVEGDTTPEQHVGVVSFNRSDASNIVPDICDRLREIVEHDLVPAASLISTNELEHLIQRVREAPRFGTIDSLLRDVLSDIAHHIGFDEMPDVGNTARLHRLHTACYETLRSDSPVTPRLDRLEDAYPSQTYQDGISEMLHAAVTYCRDRRISNTEFRAELERTFESVYAEGRPRSFDDVVASIHRCVGTRIDEFDLADDDRDSVVDADARLYEEWAVCLDDFCTVLDLYRRVYRKQLREFGVVSHTDVAYLVDAYFAGRIDGVDDAHRTRIEQRYHTRIQSLIIDEAQDVSSIQHAALSHLVTTDTRVFVAGDFLQSIYLFRHADPTLFESATDDGTYLGIDWEIHENRTATTTYRCLPDVADAINEISAPALESSGRGNCGELDVTYPVLEADREPSDETNVHIASFDPLSGDPDSYSWINPVQGHGEASIVATLLSNGIADGTFTDGEGEPLGITVLFRWRARMDAYEEAFTNAGLSVRNASQNLFECNVVGAVLDVCKWLVAPADPDRTRDLVTESELGLDPLEDDVETHQWNFDTILEVCDLTETQHHVLSGLNELREQRGRFLARPAGAYVEDVIEALALRADPNDCFSGIVPAQRVANLDALLEMLKTWEADEQYAPNELIELLQPLRANPYLGPKQPSTTDTYDVEFRTVHDAKGDQDDVIVIGNPGFDLWKHGPQAQRFITQGHIAGLAPPTNTDVPDVSLSPFRNGIYDPDDTRERDVGLRWATAHWCDDVTDSTDAPTLVGPDRLRGATANERAEGWRLLYVALTRARDHLVFPLPRELTCAECPRDRWLDVIRDGLGFTGDQTETGGLDVGINDVALGGAKQSTHSTRGDDIAVTPPCRGDLTPWGPRFLNPSTMYPLTENVDAYVLDHLLGEPLHTETNDVPEDLPLPFDRMGPDDVGACVHEVLSTLIEREVSEATLRSMGQEVRQVFDEALSNHTPRIDDDERDGVVTFFQQEVLDGFIESDLWNRIQTAESVTVERPIDGLVTVDNVEFEIHGEADIVIERSSGERHVADVKIALTELTTETRHRYELQVAAYAYLFEQQEQSAPVQRTVETFGVERETITSTWPPSVIEHRLSRLLED